MSSSVDTELYNIFTYYSLHSDPLDPEHIRAFQLVKLARDCQMVGVAGSVLGEANPPLLEADIQVAFTAEVTRSDKIAPGQALERNALKMAPVRVTGAGAATDRKKMNYNDFLTCLMKLSVKIYPRSRSRDEAFQRLLMDNVLPLAARRCPESVEFYLENAEVRSIFHTYKDALEQIFAFYASNDKRQEGSRGASGPAGFGASHSGRSPVRATKAVNTMKEALAYPEFLKFAQAFDLSNNVILSTIELGDIYLSSIKTVAPDSSMRKLSFDEFWESLVRCALVAYSKISDVTIIDKIRGLLLYMWRAINGSVPKTWADGRRTGTTNQGDLLAGAMLFNKRFTAAWAADNYRDYLSPAHAPNEDGQTVLARLKGGTGGAQLAATASSASMSASSVGAGGLAARGATDYGY